MVNNNSPTTKTLKQTQHLQYVVLTDDVACENYVLEYTTKQYISEQGIEQYKFIQQAFKTTQKLEILCRYIYNDGVDKFGSEYFVVYTNGKFLLLNWDTNTITQLEHTNINNIHKYILGLMSEV